AGVTWTSDDDAIATVDDTGLVTAHSIGSTTVTATAGDLAATAEVEVVGGDLPGLDVELVASGFNPPPSSLTSPPGDDRLFVTTLDGGVWIIEDGVRLPTMFLDLRDRIVHRQELGLYSLAFHPQYATNGYFYVVYAD